MLCWFYARCNGTHTFQIVQLLSHQSTEYLPKSHWDNQIFFGKCETSLCVLFGQQWLLPWNSPVDAVFAQSLAYCWIMNTDLNWGKWGLQFFRCCSGFIYDLLNESSLNSWSNFGRLATPGKVHHCYKFFFICGYWLWPWFAGALSLCYTFRMSNPDAYTDSADADCLYLYFRKCALVVRSTEVFHTCAVDRLEQ